MTFNMKTVLILLVAMALLPMAGLFADNVSAAASNPVKERQKLMRSVGKAMKTTVKMLRGELAYDAAAVGKAMKTMGEVADQYPGLFPDGSDMDNSIMDFDQESDAKPEIWANMADFKKKSTDLKMASGIAMKASGDKAAFMATFKNVGATCKGCHKKYKADKPE